MTVPPWLIRGLQPLNQFWLSEVSPHSYALLRIVFGLLGLLTLAAVWDQAYWRPDLLVASRLQGPETWGGGQVSGAMVGALIFWGSAASFVAMTVGWHSNAAVVMAFAGSVAHGAWNPLPLSAAFGAHRAVVFCLIWADCGALYSVDAWRAGRLPPRLQPIWPLQLIRVQICLIYFWAGATKLLNASWREGTALHYILANTQFQRIPSLAAILEPVATSLTYATLAWELLFPAAMTTRRVRTPWLLLGVALHTGMWLVLEIGPFSLVMLASYLAFLEPRWLASRLARRR